MFQFLLHPGCADCRPGESVLLAIGGGGLTGLLTLRLQSLNLRDRSPLPAHFAGGVQDLLLGLHSQPKQSLLALPQSERELIVTHLAKF
jgi:hypothetical protein